MPTFDNVSSNIGDHGIGKDVNIGNGNVTAGSCALKDDTDHEGEGRVKDEFQISFFCK